MGFFFKRPGIVNIRMVITEEKILSNIDKVKNLINPNSKKQIIKLEDDAYFKDLVESITTYFKEYPNKKEFPITVYRVAYDLVEYSTAQFEDNTKKLEKLMNSKEENIKLAKLLVEAKETVTKKENGWIEKVGSYTGKFTSSVAKSLTVLANSAKRTEEEQKEALNNIETNIQNLESNLFAEIDLERIEDSSKALSYIGIELADALKYIPTPIEQIIKNTSLPKSGDGNDDDTNMFGGGGSGKTKIEKMPKKEEVQLPNEAFFEQTRFEVQPSIWQRIKNSKFVRTIQYIFKIRIVLDYPALPEGNDQNN